MSDLESAIAQAVENADWWIVQAADGRILNGGLPTDLLYGWTVDELRNALARDLLHPDDRSLARRVREQVRDSGGQPIIHLRARAKNGRWLWVACEFYLLTPIEMPDGSDGRRTLAVLRDVSSTYLSEEALSLLLEVRELIDSSEDVGQAWRVGLDRLGRLGTFEHGLVFADVDGTLAASRRWIGEPADPVIAELPEWLDEVWESGLPRSQVESTRLVGVDEPSTGSLAVPVLAGGRVVALVELAGRTPDPDGVPTAGTGVIDLIVQVVSQIGDAVRRKQVESELALAQQQLHLAFSEAPIGMAIVGLDGRFLRVNDALCVLVGRSQAELTTIDFQEITHPDDLDIDVGRLNRVLAGEIDHYQIEKRYLLPNGDTAWALMAVAVVRLESGEPDHFIAQIQDIGARRRAEQELEWMALHDSLTGLPNRAAILACVGTAQERSVRTGELFGVLFIDLDRFKSVNDNHGHQVGDELLIQAAERLGKVFRASEIPARLGGDEFLVLCEALGTDETAALASLELVAQRARDALATVFILGDIEVTIGASIGQAVSVGYSETVPKILTRADAQMYVSKQVARSMYPVPSETQARRF